MTLEKQTVFHITHLISTVARGWPLGPRRHVQVGADFPAHAEEPPPHSHANLARRVAGQAARMKAGVGEKK
jgi:hypothetical protein